MNGSFQRRARFIVAALPCLVALTAWPAAPLPGAPRTAAPVAHIRVTAVTVEEPAGKVVVSIATTGPARALERSVRTNWAVIDILGAELAMPPGPVSIRPGAVQRIRVGQFTPEIVRVVVEFAQPVRAQISASSAVRSLVVTIPMRPSDDGNLALGPAPRGSGALSVPRITAIALWGTAARPWVSITASRPVRYHLRPVESDWAVIEIPRAELALAGGQPPPGRGIVKLIRAFQVAPDAVGIALELARRVPIHIATSADHTAIIVNFATGARTAAGSSQPPPDVGIPPSPGRAPVQNSPPAGIDANLPPVPASLSGAAGPPGAGSREAAGRPSAAATAQAGGPSQTGAVPQSRAETSSGSDYLLGPEDVLEVTVWGYPDLTRVVPVRPDGRISLPLAGTIRAAGRSAESLTRDLTRALARYIINPQVTVIVKEFRKIRVSLLGQVAHPGTYTLPPGARVLDAISMASGVTDTAALSQAELVRASGETRPLSLDAVLLQQDANHNLRLEPGDTIIVPEDTTSKFYVLGDVNHPGVYPLKGDVTVLQAIAIAGGPALHGTTTASTVHVLRRVGPADVPLTAGVRQANVQPIANGKGVLITMDLRKMMQGNLQQDETVRPSDVIMVPAPGIAMLPSILSILGLLWWLHP